MSRKLTPGLISSPLGNEVARIESDSEGARLAQAGAHAAAQDHHRDVVDHRIGAVGADQLEAVDAGHHQIEDDQIARVDAPVGDRDGKRRPHEREHRCLDARRGEHIGSARTPEEVEALLKVILVKALCRTANVEKVDAGPKGTVITLRNNEFPNPAGLVKMLSDPGMNVRIKPDQKLVFARDWPKPEMRLKGTAAILSRMAKLAEHSGAAATLAG